VKSSTFWEFLVNPFYVVLFFQAFSLNFLKTHVCNTDFFKFYNQIYIFEIFIETETVSYRLLDIQLIWQTRFCEGES
jgi:hypothetical protein